MDFKLRKKIDRSKTILYDFFIHDWSINIQFNHYASMFAWESDIEFEESLHIILIGNLVDTTSNNKKVNEGLFASLRIYGTDLWYKPLGRYMDDDDKTIGRLVYRRFLDTEKKGHLLTASIYVPTKSYETLLTYLSYKGKACIRLSGTELEKTEFRGVLWSDIYYVEFKGENGFEPEH